MKLSFFQQNILRMFKGTAVAQMAGVAGSLILAKLYGDEDFGLFGVYLSIISIVSVANTLQLDYGVVITPEKKESDNLFSSVLAIAVIIGILPIIIFVFFQDFFSHNNISFPLFLMAIVAAILLAQMKTFEAFLTRNKRFDNLAQAKIITSLSLIIFQFLLYYFYATNGLIIGSLLSLFITLFYYLFKTGESIKKPDIQLLKKSINRNKNLIKYTFPSNLTNALAINLMTILIYHYFSTAEAGAYFLSMKILMSPLLLISASIAQVYFQKSNELFLNSKQKLFDFTKKIVITNLLIMTAIILVINTVGITVLDFFFDKDWDNLIPFILVLSFLILARSSFNPISHIIVVTDKNHIGFIFNIYFLIVSIVACYVGYLYQDIMYCVYILSFVGGMGYIFLLIYFMNLLKQYKYN